MIRLRLPRGAWADVSTQRRDRGPDFDHDLYLRQLLAAFVVGTNLVDDAGGAIAPSDPESWKRIPRETRLRLARDIASLVKKGVIADE